MVDLIPVSSSNIDAVGYDPEEKILAIRFKDGGLYHYSSVEKDVHEQLVSAKSVGWHFHAAIKGKYTHSKQG